MPEEPVYFYPTIQKAQTDAPVPDVRPEPSTCTEAESFVLRVLDESMEPEFRRGCMIVIDPTGRATDGSYVLARQPLRDPADNQTSDSNSDTVDDFIFRQLRRDDGGNWTLQSLNPLLPTEPLAVNLNDVVGVIVQRAGTRRRYHKHYD